MKSRSRCPVVLFLMMSSPLAFLWGWGCGLYKPEFERNPDLALLTADGDLSCINPVWSPNGQTIYFIMDGTWGIPDNGGSLWAVDINGDNERLILDGQFGAVAISPDGTRLALTRAPTISEGGLLILVDSNGANEETLAISCTRVQDVEFSSDGSELYHFGEGAFYSIETEGQNEKRLFEIGGSGRCWGFDISPNDSILFYHGDYGENTGSFAYSIPDSSMMSSYQTSATRPQFCPVDANVVAFTGGFGGDGDVWVLYLDTGKASTLNAKTFERSSSMLPYWSPDGSKIVFSSSECTGEHPGEPHTPQAYDLWILEEVSP